jgi:hypothetical protein
VPTYFSVPLLKAIPCPSRPRWPLVAACLGLLWWASLGLAHAQGPEPLKIANEIRRQTEQAPDQNMTSFEPALRCMDRLFTTYGVRDVPLLVEEIPDATRKMNAGAREMFLSATSRMTQRSRAIRLIPYQQGSIVFSDRKDFVEGARYVLQGSVSQLDESIVRRQRDGAICLGPLCLGVAESDAYNALGLDMNIIRTSDLSLIPGVTAKNSVLVVKHGKGADGELNIGKFGINYNFTISRAEGNGQAVRALIELGAIELYGKLLKIPYWTCIGQDATQDEISMQLDDWWEGLAAEPAALVSWLQTQMAARHMVQGDNNGKSDVRNNGRLLKAVAAYKGALGLTPDVSLDAAFYRAYMSADHAKVEALAKSAATGASASVADGDDNLILRDRLGRHGEITLAAGEAYELEVQARQSGFLYCWLLDDRGALNLFFPNQARRQASVRGMASLSLPGADGFTLRASQSGQPESVACALARKDLGFNPLRKLAAAPRDLDTLRTTLDQLNGQAVHFGALHVHAR